MLKFALIAAIASVALTAIPVLPAQAQVVPVTNPCDCGFPGRGGGDTPGGSNGGGHNYSTNDSDSCGSQLGVLRRVYPQDIEGVSQEYRVWVTEVCSNAGLLRNEGNAAYLRPTIAQNDVIVAALGAKSFSANDVYAVKMMSDDTINLYVHHF